MGNPFGNEQSGCLFFRKDYGMYSTIHTRLFPQIQTHVQHASPKTENQLLMVNRRELKMHAPKRILDGFRVVFFSRTKIDAIPREALSLVSFYERSPAVHVTIGHDQTQPGQLC